MKHGLILLLMILVLIPVAQAQENERAAPLSGRYSFEIPEGWIASTIPIDGTQGLFPTEALTIAPPQTEIGGEFDTLDPTDFAGEGIVSIVWPSGILEVIGTTPLEFGSQIVTTNAAAGNVEETAFEAGEVEGMLYKVEQENGTHLRVISAEDSDKNMLLVVAFAGADRIGEIDTILATLEYTDLSSEMTPSVEIEILEDTATLQIPPSWWFADAGDVRLVVSEFTPPTFTAFEEGNFGGIEGIFMTGFEREKSLFPEEAYTDEGSLNPDVVVEGFNLAGLLGEEPNFDGEVAVETWENENGLHGILLNLTTDDGLHGEIVIVNGNEQLLAVIAVARAETWETYAEVVSEVFATLELVSE